jgi:anaerobic magnesium-protoporphyrin IX monomethyl ester cyclase
MRILLLSMPDSFEHMPAFAIRMPNGALTSLAGNIDPHHTVAVADLILARQKVRETVERLLAEMQPDVVGLSIMTFQRRTGLKICDLVRTVRPAARVVVGGYDPSLAPEAYSSASPLTVDFIVRGEGERCFSELLRALENGGAYEPIAGLSWRDGNRFIQNPARPAGALDGIELPRRAARILTGYTLLGRGIDVIETSRGCTYDCSFCSIIEMRGRNFYTFSIDRVLADIRDARDHGAETIFIVDDNIMLNVHRFERLCQAIIDAGLNRLEYFVQAMTSSIARHHATLPPLMRRAGFKYAFLGIENILEEDLSFLRAAAKNTRREAGGQKQNATVQAVEALRRNGIWVVGGLIVGNPDDTRRSIDANLDFAKRYVDWPYIQHPTPYPGTPMTKDFEERNLVASRTMEEYDGTTAVVRSETLSCEEIEFLRWKAERWIKLRYFPKAFWHNPLFVFRHGKEMLAHTFRGSSWKYFLGLEDERTVFARYKAIRQAERSHL